MMLEVGSKTNNARNGHHLNNDTMTTIVLP